MPKLVDYDPNTQAGRVIRKFGKPTNLARAMTEVGCPMTPQQIYRWTYSKKEKGRGGDGYIPPRYWPAIKQAARLYGVVLTVEDLRP